MAARTRLSRMAADRRQQRPVSARRHSDDTMGQEHRRPTALVTGAAARLGRAIALDLAKCGWRVGVHHHTAAAAAEALVADIEALGSKAVALQADLTRQDELGGLIQSCADRLGPPTCLINNAARFERDTVETLDWAGWQAELDVNLRAPVFLTQAFAKALPEGAFGSVINMIDQRVWRLTPTSSPTPSPNRRCGPRRGPSPRHWRRASVSMRWDLGRCCRAAGKPRPSSSANATRPCSDAQRPSRRFAPPSASCSRRPR